MEAALRKVWDEVLAEGEGLSEEEEGEKDEKDEKEEKEEEKDEKEEEEEKNEKEEDIGNRTGIQGGEI